MKHAKLSFLQVDRYEYQNHYICDFQDMPRPHYCMGLILDGTGIFEFDGKSVTVNKGDIIFVPVGSTYISKWCGNPDITYLSVHFSFEYPDIFPRNTKPDIQKISIKNFDDIKRIYENILNSLAKSKSEELFAVGNFYCLIGHIYPEIKLNQTEQIDERILTAVEYIQQHYNENFSIDYISNLCALSVSHFHTLFKESVGCSPIEYKHAICIRHAELLLLENTKKPIEAISSELGFESSIYFRKVFKKITGKTPREYRKIKIE